MSATTSESVKRSVSILYCDEVLPEDDWGLEEEPFLDGTEWDIETVTPEYLSVRDCFDRSGVQKKLSDSVLDDEEVCNTPVGGSGDEDVKPISKTPLFVSSERVFAEERSASIIAEKAPNKKRRALIK